MSAGHKHERTRDERMAKRAKLLAEQPAKVSPLLFNVTAVICRAATRPRVFLGASSHPAPSARTNPPSDCRTSGGGAGAAGKNAVPDPRRRDPADRLRLVFPPRRFGRPCTLPRHGCFKKERYLLNCGFLGFFLARSCRDPTARLASCTHWGTTEANTRTLAWGRTKRGLDTSS